MTSLQRDYEKDKRRSVCRVTRVPGRDNPSLPFIQVSIQYKKANLPSGLLWIPRGVPTELVEDVLTDWFEQSAEDPAIIEVEALESEGDFQ